LPILPQHIVFCPCAAVISSGARNLQQLPTRRKSQRAAPKEAFNRVAELSGMVWALRPGCHSVFTHFLCVEVENEKAVLASFLYQ